MNEFYIALVSGISYGAVYSLVGLGLVIIFRSTEVMNFALAPMVVFACAIASSAIESGVPVLLGLVIAVMVGSGSGVLVREVVVRPLGSGRLFTAVAATLGVSLIVEQIIARQWGTRPRSFPPLWDGVVVELGSYRVGYQELLTVGLATLAMVLVGYLFARTPLGASMRTVAESADTAELLGINSQRVARVAWALGMGLATLGGFLILPSVGLWPGAIGAIFFRAMAGVLLGGINSMTGAVVGGLLIGVLDNLAAMYADPSYRDTVVFSILFLVLLFRPQGMFGHTAYERV